MSVNKYEALNHQCRKLKQAGSKRIVQEKMISILPLIIFIVANGAVAETSGNVPLEDNGYWVCRPLIPNTESPNPYNPANNPNVTTDPTHCPAGKEATPLSFFRPKGHPPAGMLPPQNP